MMPGTDPHPACRRIQAQAQKRKYKSNLAKTRARISQKCNQLKKKLHSNLQSKLSTAQSDMSLAQAQLATTRLQAQQAYAADVQKVNTQNKAAVAAYKKALQKNLPAVLQDSNAGRFGVYLNYWEPQNAKVFPCLTVPRQAIMGFAERVIPASAENDNRPDYARLHLSRTLIAIVRRKCTSLRSGME